MKIHSKKTFLFVHPQDTNITVHVQHEEIKTVPDWVSTTLLFKLASTPDVNGNVDIFVIETKEQQIQADNGDLSLGAANKKPSKASKGKNAQATNTEDEDKNDIPPDEEK